MRFSCFWQFAATVGASIVVLLFASVTDAATCFVPNNVLHGDSFARRRFGFNSRWRVQSVRSQQCGRRVHTNARPQRISIEIRGRIGCLSTAIAIWRRQSTVTDYNGRHAVTCRNFIVLRREHQCIESPAKPTRQRPAFPAADDTAFKFESTHAGQSASHRPGEPS